MIEAAGALFRCLQLASSMLLIGGCVFLAIAEQKGLAAGYTWKLVGIMSMWLY